MKSWAVSSLQACISVRAVPSLVRERTQVRTNLLSLHLDERADVVTSL